MENLQMCKKEKYEKHRNVLVFFFASAMLVILNSQKLSLRTSSRNLSNFFGGEKEILNSRKRNVLLSLFSSFRLRHRVSAFGRQLEEFFIVGSSSQTKKHPIGCFLVCGGEKEIRTLVGVLAQTRFPVVRLRPTQPSLHARLGYYTTKPHQMSSPFLKVFFFFSKLLS